MRSFSSLVLSLYRRLSDELEVVESENDTILDTIPNKTCVKNASSFYKTLILLRSFIVRASIMGGMLSNKLRPIYNDLINKVNDKTLINGTTTIGSLYEKYKDEDGFLYISYYEENAFGF